MRKIFVAAKEYDPCGTQVFGIRVDSIAVVAATMYLIYALANAPPGT